MATKTANGRITDILLNSEIIGARDLEEAQIHAKTENVRLEKHLVDKGFVKPDQMTLVLSEYLSIPPITLAHFTPDQQLLDMVPKSTLTKHLMVPIARTGRSLTVAMGDPFDIIAIDEIQTQTGLDVVSLVASEHDISEALGRVFAQATEGIDMQEIMDQESDIEVGEEARDEESLEQMLESAEEAPVVRMVNMMLVEAIRTGSSDIHIEPMERSVRLRYRIDGVLVERPGPPKNLQSAVISRVKIMSDLDIAERRIPQDGRFKIRALGKEIDLRVSILPTVHGEKIVMRTLDKTNLAPNLSSLGLDEVSYNAFAHAIGQPHGMVLVTGPTGSGKTTTLYSCLQQLNSKDVNIITCEDPVEYQLAGVNQVQINNAVGLSFSTALRSILRQDPDICLVGEIRDGETAEIAVSAALTGHLVLSTLHTNDAASVTTRLIDMGTEPFLLSSALLLAQAQRLYRKLCPVCKKEAPVDPVVLKNNGIDLNFFDGATLYESAGCPKCNNLGYKGRGALMEILEVTEDVRKAIMRNATAEEIRTTAMETNGMVTLKMAGMERVRDGLTSLARALEVTGSD
ncbi:MAG: ATPase, T2SS/T4P/T4SS family [Verrucomicrobia bacterium]|nr:ATPase, T2SS/T4P/T4SS family [Verrucomicrobiota bacterium]MDA1086211.1 ATPase, T2SS/T4P/T4SS family [Verrucomicrobiota bacterium]